MPAAGTFTVVLDPEVVVGGEGASGRLTVKFQNGANYASFGSGDIQVLDKFARTGAYAVAVSAGYELELPTDVPAEGVSTDSVVGYDLTWFSRDARVNALFQGQPAGSTVLLSELVDAEPGVPPVVSAGYAAQAEDARDEAVAAQTAAEAAQTAAEAVGSTNDTIIASRVNDQASATRTALHRVAPREVNVRDYDVLTTNTASQNNTGLTALFADHTDGVTLAFPDEGTYQFSAPLPSRNNLGIVGIGWGTLLQWTSGSMIAPTTTLSALNVANIAIEGTTGASHLIDLGTTGGLTFSTFTNVDMKPKNLSASIVYMNGGTNFFGNEWVGCKLWRQPTHTVPAFNLTSTGAGLNTCRWRGGWWHSQNCNSSPFFRAEISSGSSYISKFTFEDVIGEQNLGGMIHIYSANAPLIRNIVDHDASSTYADDLFKISNSSGPGSRGVVLQNSGTAGIATFAGGKYHLNYSGSSHDIGRLLNGGNLGTFTGATNGRIIRHSGANARAYFTGTTNYVLTAHDCIYVGTSSNLRTITLPDPTALLTNGTVPPGREFVIKSAGTGGLTIVSAGSATLDGGASVSLVQWERATFVTDGTNWFRI